MYSSKVSSSMTVNKKTGETRLNDLQVSVDNYTELELLEKAKEEYNAGKDIERHHSYKSKWPDSTWHELYLGMMKNLLKWKKRRNY